MLADSQARGVAAPAAGAGGAAPPLLQQPILDLRGPSARVITDASQIGRGGGGSGAPGDDVPMPELQHNLALLVGMAEAQLQRLDAKLHHDQGTAAILTRERALLEQEVEDRGAAAARLEALAARLAQLTAGDGGGWGGWTAADADAAAAAGEGKAGGGAAAAAADASAAAAADGGGDSGGGDTAAWARLKRDFPEEYAMHRLAAAALPSALPRLTAALAGWAPLDAPAVGAGEFAAWRPLLETDAARHAVLGGAADAVGAGGAGAAAADDDPYAAAVEELVLPPLRAAAALWEPRDPEPMLAWVDAWERLLPPAALHHVLIGLVLPRVAAAVEAWDPRREAVPVHTWLHPWLPHLGPQLEALYPTLRHRLAAALAQWHPADGSARALLAPWRRVFKPADWDGLLSRSVAPKLALALESLVINPAAQDLEPFNWVLAWDGLLPGPQLAALLERGFFPKFLAVLRHWLSGARPDYDEVTRWYLAWKGLLPQALLDEPRVRSGFARALDLMNSAADGRPLPEAPPPPAGAAPGDGAGGAADGTGDGAAAEPPPPPGGRWGGPEPTLRDLVARYAEDAGLEFVPKPGRFHDGLQVYSFGGVGCVLEAATSSVRAALGGQGWAPVSLERLAAEAAKRAAARQR